MLLYPVVSDHWNRLHQSRAISGYVEAVADLNEEEYQKQWQDAQAYNAELVHNPDRYYMTQEQEQTYQKLLNINGNGIMGYLEIPSISVSLPIYHGTSDAVLQVAAGHLEGSSLPVGGLGTHTVLSGHRGLPSAKLFTDLDELSEGDRFILHILDERLVYEVEEIRVVEPEDVSSLSLEPERDLCTLVTCTPYGINTHRLLVTGHRVEETPNESVIPTNLHSDAVEVESVFVLPTVAIGVLFFVLIGTRLWNRNNQKRTEWERKDET